MSKFDKINSLFNCQICHHILQDPIFLPCSKTVCRTHSEDISREKCEFCGKFHPVPEDGFPVNELVKSLLEFQLNKINLNFAQYNHYKVIIEDLNKELKLIEAIRNDPESYISDYFSDLTREIDLRREILIRDIQEYSDELIKKIAVLREECLLKSKEKTKITESIDEVKEKIVSLNARFDSLEMDDRNHEEIMSQKESREVQKLIEPLLKEYKFELQGNKCYKLDTNEMLNLEKIFGSLNDFDYGIENDKINSAILSPIDERCLLNLIDFKSMSFSLLWRASRDGFEASTFHQICDGQPNTLTIIKDTTGCIFGGYTSLPWSSPSLSQSKPDTTAFLFTLANPSNSPLKLKVTDAKNAVIHYLNCGPAFGSGFDLYVSDLSNTSLTSYMWLASYEFPSGKSSAEGGKFILGDSNNFFQSAEIEVFQVF